MNVKCYIQCFKTREVGVGGVHKETNAQGK